MLDISADKIGKSQNEPILLSLSLKPQLSFSNQPHAISGKMLLFSSIESTYTRFTIFPIVKQCRLLQNFLIIFPFLHFYSLNGAA
ncbi:hypothetical protein C0971_03500 [Bacillus methanolicus]|nr:hypothetical protein C0971_03500 [Bacillus methanolicus]